MNTVLVRVPNFAPGEEPAPQYGDPTEYRCAGLELPVGFESVHAALTHEQRGVLMQDPRIEAVDFTGTATVYPRRLPPGSFITMEQINRPRPRWDDGEAWGD